LPTAELLSAPAEVPQATAAVAAALAVAQRTLAASGVAP